MIITFEGIEGCGKSTQIEKLKESLKKVNIEFEIFREPGGTELSEEIRNILLNREMEISPLSELFLFESARAELISQKISKIDTDKKVIILDRFVDSTVAYQGYGRGLPLDVINFLNNIVINGLKIKRTYLLDAPLEIINKRIGNKNKDRIERENSVFHNKIRYGFLEIAKQNPDRIVIIDATKRVDEIHQIILNDLLKLYEHSVAQR